MKLSLYGKKQVPVMFFRRETKIELRDGTLFSIIYLDILLDIFIV